MREKILVNFHEPPNAASPNYLHTDGLAWFPIGTLQLDANSILKLKLVNKVDTVMSGEIAIDGFKLTPHVAREVMKYDH